MSSVGHPTLAPARSLRDRQAPRSIGQRCPYRYFGLKGSAEMQEPGSLDSIPRFLSDLRKLPPEEQATVLSVHLLAQVMDGGVREPELVLWRRIGLARGLAVDESAVKGVACAFRNHETLGAALLAAALDDDPSNDHAEALGLSDTCWFRVRGVFSLRARGCARA